MKHTVTTYNTKRMLADSLKKAMKEKSFSKITVSEIIVTIDAEDKVGGLILNTTNRYVLKLSEIYIMGNPALGEQE